MKKIITIILCFSFFGVCNTFSQTVRDIPLKDIDAKYIQIVGFPRMLTNKIGVFVDFGQENQVLGKNNNMLRDENDEIFLFNSMIDALNFFSRNGFEFEQVYEKTRRDEIVYFYILKKKVN